MGSRSVVIVGGGVSGLSLAYRLHQARPSLKLTVLEKNPKVGGNIGTRDRQGYRVERGPNGFLDAKPHTMELCADLGLKPQLIAASEGARKNRYVLKDGKIQALPSSLMSFIRSPLLSWRGKLSLLMEKYRKPRTDLEEESIRDFASRRAGREVADLLADALVTGIHAGDPALLSVKATFPRMVQFEKDYGSVMRGFTAAGREKRKLARAKGEQPQPQRMWSFQKGLQVLIDTLEARLAGCIQTGVTVKRLEQQGNLWRVCGEGTDSWEADAVVLTNPAYEQAIAIADCDAELAQLISEIPYTPVVVVALGFPQTAVGFQNLDGFGYIAPQNTKRDILGVQWCSSIFPDRAPAGQVLWRALCGGWNRQDILNWDNEQLTRAVVRELRETMKITGEPNFVEIIRWPKAIPQYHLGHLSRVEKIEQRQKAHKGLFLGGNSYYGVAINDCTENACKLCQKILNFLDELGNGPLPERVNCG